MASFGVSASGATESLTGGATSYGRMMVAAGDNVVIAGSALGTRVGETSTTIRWALVAIELEARSKGGVIRLQQEAKL